MAAEAFNLTGKWKGIFNYPRVLPPNQFDAEIRDHMGALTGATFEIGDGFRNKGQPLHAMIEGHRSGSEVTFVKFYDALNRAHIAVHYAGNIGANGNEISGQWHIPGNWSGTFLMIRATPKAAAAERKIAETVR